MLFKDPALASRQLVADVLKQQRIDGVRGALDTIAAAMFAAEDSGQPPESRAPPTHSSSGVPKTRWSRRWLPNAFPTLSR
ncbi:MAG: hypothetical protein H6893_06645 [Brucellaceae bacterium]|nr:hypothetical protein [Brucellaceae bacterium]